MLLADCFRLGNTRASRLCAALVLVGLFAFLTARLAPPEFPRTSSSTAAINADSNHGGSKHNQRPRFDNDGSQWIAPVRNFHPIPSARETTQLATSVEIYYKLQTKGFHYNRPPPVS